MKRTLILDIISSLFVILFFDTGIAKLFDQATFREALIKSPLLVRYQAFIGISIPVLEILIAISLLIPMFKENNTLRKWGLAGSFVLMAVFTLYVAYMLKFVPDRPCSCGGIIQKMNWHQHLYFNTGFTILALWGMLLNKKHIQSANHLSLTT